MPAPFLTIEPYETGFLDVEDGQSLYWEACGNPGRQPAVVLHGGPGSGCTSGAWRLFDPDANLLILFDQRGAGRSRPRADAITDLSTNTVARLVVDMGRLREHVGVERQSSLTRTSLHALGEVPDSYVSVDAVTSASAGCTPRSSGRVRR